MNIRNPARMLILVGDACATRDQRFYFLSVIAFQNQFVAFDARREWIAHNQFRRVKMLTICVISAITHIRESYGDGEYLPGTGSYQDWVAAGHRRVGGNDWGALYFIRDDVEQFCLLKISGPQDCLCIAGTE